MHFLDLTLPTLAENLALEEALLLEAEAGRGGEVLRLWEWPDDAVILGAGCRLAEDVDEAACRDDGVPILRRASGGGTVLLGKGCLNFSLVLAFAHDPTLCDITASYRFILERIGAALRDLTPGVAWRGTSDLAAFDRKFSGNSQQRKRHFLLHQGTLLYAFAGARVSRYLRSPARQPDYRRRRLHAEFLMNLPANAVELTRRLRVAWGAEGDLPHWPAEAVRRLVREKYGTPAWVQRR